MWNNPNDPMPIKTTNMAGLQKWEETEDYIIYLCKDATMTTVQNYVTGTFQEFQERKAQIEASQELMRSYNIEWTDQDSIDLINEINNEALAKMESNPMMLPVDVEETPNGIQVLSPKALPVTYECCFRVDKLSGELYIEEGYENYFGVPRGTNVTITEQDSNGYATIEKNSENGVASSVCILKTYEPLTEYNFSWNILEQTGFFNIGVTAICFGTPKNSITTSGNFSATTLEIGVRYDSALVRFNPVAEKGSKIKFVTTIVKGVTPKPFVKSVMPSGKLDIISNANETTHTFLNKGDGVVTFGNGYFSLKGEKIQQLLVYNTLLTEQEKQTELAKDLRIR